MIPHSHFTASSDVRYYLNAPANHGNYTLASNGHAILLSPREPAYDANHWPSGNIDNIIGIIEQTPLAAPTQPIILPPKSTCRSCDGDGIAREPTTCPECDGEGELKFSTRYNDYTVDCDTCCGHGETHKILDRNKPCPKCLGTGQAWLDGRFDEETVVIDNIHYKPLYISLIIDQPYLQIGIAARDSKLPCALIFGTGNQRGAIMPMAVKGSAFEG